jgi:hypothetical protein
MILILCLCFFALPLLAKGGCTDPQANNYNPQALQNDGSCLYDTAGLGPLRSWVLPNTLDESSGLCLWNNLLWSHNDDGDRQLYAFDSNSIAQPQPYALSGLGNVDWEELAQDSSHWYLGDFGNNANGNRQNLRIYRIEKASLLAGSPLVDTLRFSYERQTNFNPTGGNQTNFDCEAMIVAGDSLYLFTKEWLSNQTSLYVLHKRDSVQVAQWRDSLMIGGLVTGACYLPEQRLILLCGYSSFLQPFLYLLYDFQGLDFFGGNKRKLNLHLPFHQVEGLSSGDGLELYLSNERFNNAFVNVAPQLHRLDLSLFLRPYLSPTSDISSLSKPTKLRLYPNPSPGAIQVEGIGVPLPYQLIDVLGRVQGSGLLKPDGHLDASLLSPGFYWLRLPQATLPFQVKGN